MAKRKSPPQRLYVVVSEDWQVFPSDIFTTRKEAREEAAESTRLGYQSRVIGPYTLPSKGKSHG